MAIDKPGLELLASEQSQVLSRGQLNALGIDCWRIRNQVRARRWQIVGKRVVVLHSGELTSDQQIWAAVLEAGAGVAVCAATASQRYGLSGFESERVQVLVAHGTRVHQLPFVRVHVSRRYRPDRDIAPNRRLPIVSPERAFVDTAVWQPTARRAGAVLAAAVRQGLTTPARLQPTLVEAGTVRYQRLLLRLLDDLAGGSQALSEVDFVRLCRRAGLPRPRQQVVRTDSTGRRRYLDAEFDLPDGEVLVVEIDGALHLEPRTWWDDQLRQNDIALASGLVLRFPSLVLHTEPDVVVAQLRRAFARHAGGVHPAG
jgi:hypothetical protein